MRHFVRKSLTFAVLTAALAVVLTVAALAQYTMTVNKDRLVNAQNEPQNWLMMNGDYGSTRYSKLTQINRDNVKNLRMVWALALGGMQDVGQNGPENEVNPLIDNGFMYTTDGWGTIYKIDARDPNKGEFVWVTDPGVKHQGNVPRTRGIALWEDLVIANLPDGRVIAIKRDNGEIVWDKNGGGHQRVRQPGKVLHGADHRRRQGHHRQRRGRRQDARLDCGARSQNRQGTVALVCRFPNPAIPAAKHGRIRTTLGKPAAGASGRPARTILRRGLPSGEPATRFRNMTRRPVPATTCTPIPSLPSNIDTGKLAWYFQYTPNDSWDYDEVGVHMLYDTTIGGQTRKVVEPFWPQRILLFSGSDERQDSSRRPSTSTI